MPGDPEPGGRGKAGSASDNPRRSLRLGAMEATAASRLPPLLTRFQQQCPQVDITLITQPTRQLTEGVLTAALDAALVCLPPGADGQPACPAELAFTPVFYETLMLVRPQTPGPLRFAAFASGCSYRALGERWLAEQQAAVEVHEVNSYHSMLACVASGRYACLLPQSVLSLMTLPENCLSEPLCEATTQLIWRSGLSAPRPERVAQAAAKRGDWLSLAFGKDQPCGNQQRQRRGIDAGLNEAAI